MTHSASRRGSLGGIHFLALLLGALWPAGGLKAVPGLLAADPGPADFPLVEAGSAAPIFVDSADRTAVARAANDLAADVERVAGTRPVLQSGGDPKGQAVVLVGELGHSRIIDRLARDGRLDAKGVEDEWESTLIKVVANPCSGVGRALVIAGSDRRGTVFGIYDISEAIGVSPWYWWADVPVVRRRSLWISGNEFRRGSPAVKFRGIFLNDEDWCLRPWASRTYDPETGNLGPKTYARIFELLLRLHGNLLWPAMHPGTRAFNFYPANRKLADEYGIVMGSSHAEPMLRDNVDEWERDGRGEYDYGENRAAVLAYWEKRVRENARYENLYTEGMRGIHDGPMAGGGSIDEKAGRLRGIIGDQRNLLKRWVDPDPTKVPQIFCPYKEVLPIYEHDPSLVPDDVTLVWPDDNFGYLRHLSTQQERRRSGGGGVYYHVSYWGAPYDYLWLCSTPPAQIGEELTKVARYDSRRVWVLNVGDLKPAEMDTEFFMRLAWNPAGWSPAAGQYAFLRETAARDFGTEVADEIASIMDEYYRLNFARKPEHMGLDPQSRELSEPPPFTVEEAQARLAAFERLASRADKLRARIRPEGRDAYFELVQYPVDGAALMNQRGLYLFAFAQSKATDASAAGRFLAVAQEAQRSIDSATAFYNDRLAAGKWRGMMSDDPREQGVYRLPGAPAAAPAGQRPRSEWRKEEPRVAWDADVPGLSFGEPPRERGRRIEAAAADAVRRTGTREGHWSLIGGLGYSGNALAVEGKPGAGAFQAAHLLEAPSLSYSFDLPGGGVWSLTVRRLPTWVETGRTGTYAVGFDGEPPTIVTCDSYDGENDVNWRGDVLRNASYSHSQFRLSAGRHTLTLWALDPSLVLDALCLTQGDPGRCYSWPE